MKKILVLSFCTFIGLYCSQTHAQKTIQLEPNEVKSLTNSTLWTLNATCVVQNDHQNVGKIKINVLKNNGVINGKKLSNGQGTLIQIKNHSSVYVSAESGTQINLINLGSDIIRADCSN